MLLERDGVSELMIYVKYTFDLNNGNKFEVELADEHLSIRIVNDYSINALWQTVTPEQAAFILPLVQRVAARDEVLGDWPGPQRSRYERRK